MSKCPALAIIYLLLSAFALRTHADSSIVYSARYYNPLHVRGNSHSHIYRIDPNGKNRIQLTFEKDDDFAPSWSPDGKLIVFTRLSDHSPYPEALHIISERGAIVRRFPTSEWSLVAQWVSPTRLAVEGYHKGNILHRRVYSTCGKLISDAVASENDNDVTAPGGTMRYDVRFDAHGNPTGEIINNATKQIVGHTDYPYDTVLWLNADSFGGIRQPDPYSNSTAVFFDICDGNGKRNKSYELHMKAPPPDPVGNPISALEDYSALPHTLILFENWHATLVGDDKGIFLLDTKTWALTFVADSRITAWSPGKKLFCGSPGHTTSNYAVGREGRWLQVITSPLEVVNVPKRQVKVIQGGLVDVDSADWRGGSHE